MPGWELVQALYLTGSLGASVATGLPHDGLWYQEAFPHSFERTGLAYRGGIGARMGDGWRVEAGYVKLGNVESSSYFVWDQHYDPQAHVCVAQCATPHYLHTTTSFKGVDVTVARELMVGEVRPFLKLGGMMLWHTNTLDLITSYDGLHVRMIQAGMMPGIVGGGGVCYKMVCAEVLIYQALGQTMNPISTQFIVPQMTVQLDYASLWGN